MEMNHFFQHSSELQWQLAVDQDLVMTDLEER